MRNLIITIGREYGSMGCDIGKDLAKRLDIPYYDKELIERAAKETGIHKEIFEMHDEQKNQSLLFSIAMGGFGTSPSVSTAGSVSIVDRVFLAQIETIKKIAKEGSCVIIGRCANYILKSDFNCLNVFITANMEDKIKYGVENEGLSEKKAKDVAIKTDKRRAAYYNYYTNEKWADRSGYDIMLNRSSIGLELCADIIEEIYKKKIKEI